MPHSQNNPGLKPVCPTTTDPVLGGRNPVPYTTTSTKSKLLAAGLVLALAGIPAIAQNSGGNSQETKPAAGQADLPSIERLTEMTVEAVGGRENIEKIKTLHTVMTMSVGGMNITMDNKWSRSGGRMAKSETPFGNSEMGSDGTTAWTKLPDGSYVILEGDQASQLDSQASMHMGMIDPKELKKNMETMEVTGREEFDGRMAYKVKFQPKASQGSGFMYFDVNNGMPLGMKQTESTPMGEQTTTMTLADWKTVEGVKFFHTMKVTAPGMPGGGSADMKVTTLEVNKLDESAFALPAQVKEMAAGSGGSEDQGTEEAAGDDIKLEDLPEASRDQIKQTIASIKQGGAQAIEAALQQYERALPQIPEGDMKLQLQYMIQELKKAK